jgi:defect-in-organelle-trafficking protein DotD
MARTSRLVCGLVVATLLSGCAGVTPVPTDVATTGMPNAELALQNSLTEVRAAMGELNGMAMTPAVAQPVIVPGELNRPIKFAWNGPLDQGVQKLADLVGYHMSVSAPQNGKPVVVSVQVSNVTALDAFRAIGNAAGTAATVVVDPQHQSVAVEHHV